MEVGPPRATDWSQLDWARHDAFQSQPDFIAFASQLHQLNPSHASPKCRAVGYFYNGGPTPQRLCSQQ